jgi:hypothetical protein
VVPLLAMGLLVAVIALPVLLLRRLGRSIGRIKPRRRRRMPEPVRKPAPGH